MATIHDSSIKFFSKASSDQWLFVLSQYKEVFKHRAQATRGSKKSGPQEAIKLDNWYQEELPKILLTRKDKHLRHEELVQITKWKLWRTKNRAGLLDLVRMNTELAVKQVSTKAFKKCPSNLHGAISALVNLKGIGVATASAVLCACFPEICPFMADECLDSVPGIENTNYTVNEFIAFADQIKACCERLQAEDPSAKWTPHKVELTLWTHYWIKEMKLNLLEKMPTSEGLEEDETEETGSSIDNNNISRNNGGSHVKLSSTSSSNGGGGVSGRVVDEDSNISVPVSNASEVDDDDSRSVDATIGGKNNNGTCSSSNSSRLMMMNNSNTNSNSAYNCIEDSKDGMVRSISSIVDENSRQQMLSNGDNSNLSYSNLSSDDLNNSTTENTTDNGMDCPTNLSMPTGSNNNNITGSNVESSISSSSTTTTATTSSSTTISNIDTNTNTDTNMNTTAAAVPIATAINNNNNNDNSITSDVTSSTLTPLPPPPPPPAPLLLPQAPLVVATPVVVVTHPEEGETSTVVPVVGTTSLEAESGTSNGHIASNGESYNGVDNEIKADKVCSSSNNISSNSSNNSNNSNNTNLKRPVEEITSSGDDLKDDGISEKKSRIE